MIKANPLPTLEVLNSKFYYDETSPSCLRWKVERRSGKGIGYKRGDIGDVAGRLDGRYYRLCVCGKQYLVHRIIWAMHGNTLREEDEVDHRDGVTTNNKYPNLRRVDPVGNAQNQKKYKNNPSGVTGVNYREIPWNGSTGKYWIAYWKEKGRDRSKAFSVKIYGYAVAKALAISWREKMIRKLNSTGEQYTRRHGKEVDSSEQLQAAKDGR